MQSLCWSTSSQDLAISLRCPLNVIRYFFLLISVGFLLITLEINYLHSNVVSRNVWASVPIYFCCLAFVITLLLFFVHHTKFTRFLFVFFIFGTFLGIYGVFLHTGFRKDPFLRLINSNLRNQKNDLISKAEPLPPLAISGLSTMALLTLIMIKEKQANNTKNAHILTQPHTKKMVNKK